MQLHLTKVAETANSTLSILEVGSKFLGFIIEDGHRNIKDYGNTRIAGGKYQIIPRTYGTHYERYKKRFNHQFSIEIKDVPNFTDILIHIGNTVKNTLGCPLINFQASYDTENDLFRGYESTTSYLLFYELIKKAFDQNQEVWITIER